MDKDTSIKHWPEDERPRERLIKYGGSVLSDAQLIGIIIGSGDPQTKKSAVDLGRDLLAKFGDFYSLDRASISELCAIKGIGDAKAAQIKAALEIGKRMAAQRCGVKIKLGCAEDFVHQYAPFMRNLKKEIVKVVLLDSKLQVIRDLNVSEGSLNASIVHPREVMISAIKESASSLVLLHNHPSGDPSPSQHDLEITHRLQKSGEIIGIKLLDHIIIGGADYYSFAEQGLL
ncbi:MAG: JAB domain-containing protein [Candidatus Nitrohelix vancouverensis]|uniref:JAB domain-containing protein n=1 Tax=Candidatus Nitrohelix vancouverensis TaxID=2705534 RepID=A0A7T0BZT5_9BACT|nr:MAG: JAB domain-containing protein [Candidatus Nitrohelix vancouverensis]